MRTTRVRRVAALALVPLLARCNDEALRTLATYRKAKDGVMFGVYVAHAARGRLRVGDVVVPTAVSAAT